MIKYCHETSDCDLEFADPSQMNSACFSLYKFAAANKCDGN